MCKRPLFIFCWVLMGLVAVACCRLDPAHAFSRRGRINASFSYEDLAVKGGIVYSARYGRLHSCIFRGKIVSTAGSEQQNVTIRFFAMNIFDEQMWETSIHINSLPPYETHAFKKRISCQNEAPYRWRIEIDENRLK